MVNKVYVIKRSRCRNCHELRTSCRQLTNRRDLDTCLCECECHLSTTSGALVHGHFLSVHFFLELLGFKCLCNWYIISKRAQRHAKTYRQGITGEYRIKPAKCNLQCCCRGAYHAHCRQQFMHGFGVGVHFAFWRGNIDWALQIASSPTNEFTPTRHPRQCGGRPENALIFFTTYYHFLCSSFNTCGILFILEVRYLRSFHILKYYKYTNMHEYFLKIGIATLLLLYTFFTYMLTKVPCLCMQGRVLLL